MHLHSYRLRNYRRLRDVHINLADDISIFVGANNSGKTSATQALDMFVSGEKRRFSLFDFSSHTWKIFNDIGELPVGDETPALPPMALDLWFQVAPNDLYLVMPLLPSTAWQGTLVGMRIEFAARNPAELIQKFQSARTIARAKAAELPEGAGKYVPWPKDLSDYLHRELRSEFEFRYYVLDRTRFGDDFAQNEDYEPLELIGEPGGATILKSLVRVDYLSAQRHLADPSSASFGGSGRAEDLSKRLSRFYQHNLEQRQDDHGALKALFESEAGLNTHLAEVFEGTLKRLATLGYPGLHNPRMVIKSALNPESIMSQDAKVHYVLGEGDEATAPTLPDSYNGLGFKNLIYMVVEILDLHARWEAEAEVRRPLHLIFIEEPEAHLHSQLQQVFIRNVLELLKIEGEHGGAFHSQTVVTTHSPHILYERGFRPIRYFRRLLENGEQNTDVLNLSAFYDAAEDDRDFLQRYLKLTHCDLFFADAAILVEGNVERLLMPVMIEQAAKGLRSACICILEVGGAFGHRFRSLIEFLGIITLVVTDIDSVALVEAGTDPDEDEDEAFELPAEGDGEPVRRYGKACLPGVDGAATSNQTLIKWLPGKQQIQELFEATVDQKIFAPEGSGYSVRVAYQVRTNVQWAGQESNLCGRTLEEAFGLENAEWCQAEARKSLGLRLRPIPASPSELAERLHRRVKGKGFDKTRFALGVLTEDPTWAVLLYIREGLVWLQNQVDIEIAPAAGVVAEEPEEAAE